MRREQKRPARTLPAGSAFAMWVGGACALLAVLTLIGWYSGVRALQTFGPGSIVTRPLAAIAVGCAGSALTLRALLRAPRASRTLAATTSVLGVMGLIDHYHPAFGIGTGVAVRLLRIGAAGSVRPMAAPTAVCLIVVGIGIALTWHAPTPRWASACAFVAAVPPAAMLAAYIYDLRLTSPSDLNRMSFPTSVAMLSLAAAIWWLRGPQSAVRVLAKAGPGGSMARRLVPVGIVVPLLLGWPRVIAFRHHLFGPTVSMAVGQVEVAVLFATAVFWAAVSIERTEDSRREEAVVSQKRGAQLARAQRLARIGSWERDITTGESEWSEELHRLLGYQVGWVNPSLGAFLDRVAPRDRKRVATAIEHAVRDGETLAVEFAVTLPDGTVKKVEAQGNVETIQGRPARFVGVAQDVTEQRRIEDALRESEDRYRIIIEGAAEGIWVSDARGRTSLVNPRMSQMLGYSIDELSALPLEAFLRDEGAAVRRRASRPRRAGVVDRYEAELVRNDGRTLWVNVTTNPLVSPSGTFLGSLALISDISARKEAEAALHDAYQHEREAVERLQAIDDMKDAFLAAVSHELRTPLTGVLGFAATLQQRDDSLNDEERSMITDRLMHNAQRLQRLLTDLLDLDRLKRGAMMTHRRLVNVEELIREVAEHVDPAGHALTIDVDQGLDAFLDAPKIERIVENLLTNAVRHTGPGTRIWLSATRVDAGLVVAVDDDGPGIDDRSKSVIFEPFQTGPGRKLHSPGTGIGLSLVSRFAALHGGRSWIEDRPGGGSSFKVFLPRGEADAAHIDTGAA